MRALIAVLALLLSASFAHAASQNGAPRRLIPPTTVGAGGSGAAFQYDATGLSIPSFGYGIVAVRITTADTVLVDSIAAEVFLFVDTGVDSSGFAPLDLDDSSPRLDGWFLTTLDSTRLAAPGNLTPITGAASTQPKYPYDVSRRVVFGIGPRAASGVPIPESNQVRYGFGGTGNAQTRWFFCTLNDAYGGAVRGANRITIGFLNRHPRVSFTGTAWLLPSVD